MGYRVVIHTDMVWISDLAPAPTCLKAESADQQVISFMGLLVRGEYVYYPWYVLCIIMNAPLYVWACMHTGLKLWPPIQHPTSQHWLISCGHAEWCVGSLYFFLTVPDLDSWLSARFLVCSLSLHPFLLVVALRWRYARNPAISRTTNALLVELPIMIHSFLMFSIFSC